MSINKFKELLVTTIGTIIVAFAVFFFLTPSHLSIASVSGLGILLSKFIPVRVSLIVFVLNMICLTLSYFLISKEYAYKTAYASVLMPAVIAILEILLPDYQSVMGDAALDMVCYLFFVGLGQAILFNNNSSSGGIDVIAKIVNKYFFIDYGAALSVAGMAVSCGSFLVYDVRTSILSVLGTYLNGIVLDNFIFQTDGKKKVCILSKKHDEIRQYIIEQLHSGATIYEAFGGFNNEKQLEIIVIVDKNEYAKLMGFIQKIDDNAFVTVYSVKEIKYKPKVISK